MSDTQVLCGFLLIVVDIVFNGFGWGHIFDSWFPNKCLLTLLIIVDAITVIILVLGALGVFG